MAIPLLLLSMKKIYYAFLLLGRLIYDGRPMFKLLIPSIIYRIYLIFKVLHLLNDPSRKIPAHHQNDLII